MAVKKVKKKSPGKLEDSAWKDLVEELFPQFLEFFFYDLYKEIDFSRKMTNFVPVLMNSV